MSYPVSFPWQPDRVRLSRPSGGSTSRQARRRELKLKLAALEKEYGDVQAALFEAAQVHRRLCAPRLVRCGAFEIASEIFAVRYLPGDFFTVEESNRGLILALGDVCGKGLAAGMWTPCLVGLVRAHAAVSSEPQAIVAGVNREFCRMLRAAGSASADAVLFSILGAVQDFAAPNVLADDTSLVVVRRASTMRDRCSTLRQE